MKGSDIQPLNDLCKVELSTDEFGFGGDSKTTAESGVLVELPANFPYFGFWSFAFENSLMNKDTLMHLHKHYKELIGKRVYWTALSEKGNIIEKEGKRYAFIKLTSLIAADDADAPEARNLHSDGAGAFSI